MILEELTSPYKKVLNSTYENLSVGKKRKTQDKNHIGHPNPNISDEIWKIVLECCESLVLFCGPYLPEEFQLTIELFIRDVLVCISKGVLPPHDLVLPESDKGMRDVTELKGNGVNQYSRRVVGERIRSDSEMQLLVLRLAVADLISSKKDGRITSNISLLKSACKALITCPRQVGIEASKAGLIIELAINPTSVAVPCRNLREDMKEVILRSIDEDVFNPASSSQILSTSPTKEMSSTVATEVNQMADDARHFDVVESNFAQPIIEESESVPQLAGKDDKVTHSSHYSSSSTASSDESETEFPDINIDDDPD